jgi:hypothetical protein
MPKSFEIHEIIQGKRLNFDESDTFRSSVDTSESVYQFRAQIVAYEQQLNQEPTSLNLKYTQNLQSRYQFYRMPSQPSHPSQLSTVQRAQLVDWLLQYAVFLRLKRSTFYNAIYILD